MADKPNRSSGSIVSNIMGILRGNFASVENDTTVKTLSYGSPELISNDARNKILNGAFRAVDETTTAKNNSAMILGMVQASLSKVGSERLENRKILQLMPEVDKAARLMIASTFAPNDLSGDVIKINLDLPDVEDSYVTKINEFATNFFQDKLNLKTAAPKWVYQWGYESGSTVFAVVPLRSFEQIQKESYIGVEQFVNKVVEPASKDSIFGFGDKASSSHSPNTFVALEKFTDVFLTQEHAMSTIDKSKIKADAEKSEYIKNLVKAVLDGKFISLTDNPDVLSLATESKHFAEKKINNDLNARYKRPIADPIVSISAKRSPDGEGGIVDNPILMRLPPESVTIIHTPGDPNDHQGYLVLLDRHGNPINALGHEEDSASRPRDFNANQGNVFNQVYNAYGFTSGFRGMSNEDSMNSLYTQIISEHLRSRVANAGYTNVEIGNSDSVFRCMFARFLQQKHTRVLFLPKALVSYMTFEMDQNGYGISRLDRIKFSLGLKMAVQISRVLAAIKAAMDHRNVNITFTENLNENPETIFQTVIREYLHKSTMAFSIDPTVIQNQIADKSISIKGTNIPGCEQFEITNEPDSRSSSFDFDPSLQEYLDKSINNGLHVPAATMNALNEDDYARSVVTTNLFFAMDVALDQDIVIKNISDLIRKYARYSKEFIDGIYEIFPSLKTANETSSTDNNDTPADEKNKSYALPEEYTVDSLIDAMSIALPKPNIAPSKAQFESVDAMITAITNTIGALFPDDLIGSDDTLSPVVRLLRAKFTSSSIRNYLESSGMTSMEIPDNNFSGDLSDIATLQAALQNVRELMKDTSKLTEPKEPVESTPGY